jgi:hypothetical protein
MAAGLAGWWLAGQVLLKVTFLFMRWTFGHYNTARHPPGHHRVTTKAALPVGNVSGETASQNASYFSLSAESAWSHSGRVNCVPFQEPSGGKVPAPPKTARNKWRHLG